MKVKIKTILRRRWYVFILLILLVGYFYYQNKSTQVKTSTEKKYTVRRDTLKEFLSLSGQIQADQDVTLHFQSSGMLSWVGVKEGDIVKKGQLIATLDKREIQKRLQKYLANYTKTRLDFDQKQDDNKDSNILSLTDDQRRATLRIGDKSQNDLNSAVLDVEIQNLALEYANLFSPIDGIVVKANSPYAGVNITPAQAEFEIINPNTLYFSAIADQTEVIKLQSGKSGEIVFDAYSDNKNYGTISTISYTPKRGETGTVYEVKLSFNQYSNQYRLGMTGDVSFPLTEKVDVLSAPASYILSEKDKKYVWKLVNGNKEKQYIKVGDVYDSATEVLSGLKEGDQIVEK